MGCHQSAVALSRSVTGGVRPNRTMSYPDRLRRPLWDHQYRHYCHHHEYQSRRQDPPAGSPLPSASGGTEPTRSRRRRTQPAAESVPPDPGACQPPFPPRFRLFTLPPGIVTHPPPTPSPASPIRRLPRSPPRNQPANRRGSGQSESRAAPPCPRQNPTQRPSAPRPAAQHNARRTPEPDQPPERDLPQPPSASRRRRPGRTLAQA